MIDALLHDIAEKGWGILTQYLPAHTLDALKQDLLRRQEAGHFKQASIGKVSDAQIRIDIRGDETLWWQDDDLTKAQNLYYQNINTLRQALNEAFFTGLKDFECHYACYPIGAFYQRHLDSFRKTNLRLISCILYLNEDWEASQGGQLRIYSSDNEYFTDIMPVFGTLVCMRSDLVWHEVLPAIRTRYSITGWLRKEEIFL